MRKMNFVFAVAAAFAAFSGCTKKNQPEPTPAEKGRRVYATHCVACHNSDPKVDGAVGPAVFASSLELLELRLLKAEYPAGYKPKRQTRQMTPLPFLKAEIPALHAYLNSP